MIAVSNFHVILNAFQRQKYLLFDSAEHKQDLEDSVFGDDEVYICVCQATLKLPSVYNI